MKFQNTVLAFLAILTGCASGGNNPDRNPEAEKASFRFADPDLRITLVASEPDIVSPVDMAWAADGSLFVAEMPGYPIIDNLGSIKRLTDPDGDGFYQLASVFATGLNSPTSLMFYRGGILVTDAPDILFLKDTDGDGKADQREVILSGFTAGNEQLRVNDPYWGLDNWIYGANGHSGGTVGFADGSDEISIDNRDFRFNLTNKSFEAISGLSQFGLAQDNWGNRFISYNHRFARQVVLEERHLARNPSLAVMAIFDTGQSEHDRRVYTLLKNAARFNRDAVGYFTSLSGLSAYRGNLMGPSYQGDLFAGESVQSAVIHRRLRSDGVTFAAIDTHPGTEFLASPDDWFHPVNFANGPDGALYMVDFYRKYVEHPEWAEEDRKKGVDWRLGEEHGRIWRIAHKDSQWDADRMKPGLDEASAGELVEQLADPAGWRRDMAQQLLVDGGQTDAGPYLQEMLNSQYPEARSHSLWTLNGLELLTEPQIMKALDDEVAEVQVQAIRLAESRLADAEPLVEKLVELAQSEDPLVRFQAILGLGRVETEIVQERLIGCARQHHDPWTRVALLSSVAPWSGDFAQALLVQRPAEPAKEDLTFFRQIGAMVANTPNDQTPGWIVGMIEGSEPFTMEESVFLAGYLENATGLGLGIPDLPTGFYKRALLLAGDYSELPLAMVGVELLGYSDSKVVGQDLLQIVLESESNEIQKVGIQTIASMGRSELVEALFENLVTFQPSIRKSIISSSLRSDEAASGLLNAIRDGIIEPTEVPEEIRLALLAYDKQDLQKQAVEVLGSAVNADRQTVVDQYLAELAKQTVDLPNGASIFAAHCSTCHSISGVGGLLGPDLTTIGNRSDEVLLVSILDPSRVVSYELRLDVVITRSGQVFSGMLSAETAESITLRQPDGKEHTILRGNIKERTGTGKSIMPEGFERQIDEKEMADLIGFLRQPVELGH